MRNRGDAQRNDLAEWLRRVIVIGGYAIGSYWIVYASFLIAWSLVVLRGRSRFPWTTIPVLWDHFAVLSASLLLVAGAWGFQRRRRWGRPFLIAHAVLTIITVASMHVISLVQYLPVLNGLPTKLATLTGEINLAMCESLFAIFLLLCMRRPELRDAFSHSRRGFVPLFAPEQPMPAIPAVPAAESCPLRSTGGLDRG